MKQLAFLEPTTWEELKDGYVLAFRMFSRHYSYKPYKDNRRNNPGYRNRFLICGPGEKLLLMTPNRDALFVWRKFISDDGQAGINCAVFRNESTQRSSELIKAAMDRAWLKWPGERLYTYVDQNKILSSNPGYCYQIAGWRKLEDTTKEKKLVILEYRPEWRDVDWLMTSTANTAEGFRAEVGQR